MPSLFRGVYLRLRLLSAVCALVKLDRRSANSPSSKLNALAKGASSIAGKSQRSDVHWIVRFHGRLCIFISSADAIILVFVGAIMQSR
jgi:hypothetical protein